ncbi:DUF924 domain-containing protein [Sphingobium sp. H39-3-25]|uniref:DUF924 family protein n=1 Tax=Sphingobium arseniciresistens TaxID=3030834 RepID=UPI0023B917B0|nr:DUF924 domain-containing protein [Sphingobium arseniciresistens]
MASMAKDHDDVTAHWARRILDFWFKELGESGWWTKSDRIDATCMARFSASWHDLRVEPSDMFLQRADEALAAVILFDQMPRNMFRHEARAFETDPLARDIARGAVAKGYDVQIGGAGRMFFYMPFQHSEALEDQQLSLTLFEGLDDTEALAFARKHHDVIARFGRFPHRDAMLGRTTAPEEEEAARLGAQW